MGKENLNRGLAELGIFVNSLLSFLVAALLLKGIIAFVRYKVILHYSGMAARLNFEAICVSSPFSKMWTYSAVYAIYGIGILVALVLFIVAEVLFNVTSKLTGVLKLVFLWLSLLSLQHCFGFVFKGVILNQEFYYVLKWLHFPNILSYIVGVLSLFLFVLLIYFRYNRYLLIASSRYLISDTFLKKRFAVINFFIVALVGYMILFSMNSFKIQPYEMIELGILLFALLVSLFGRKTSKIMTLPSESTSRINIVLIVLAMSFILLFHWIK